MCALRECVHSGVGPACAVNSHTLAAYTLKSALKIILNRVAMGLALPSCKPRSVVGDDQFQPLRHPSFTAAFLRPSVPVSANRDTPVKSFAPPLDRHNRASLAFFGPLRVILDGPPLWSAARPMSQPGTRQLRVIFR